MTAGGRLGSEKRDEPLLERDERLLERDAPLLERDDPLLEQVVRARRRDDRVRRCVGRPDHAKSELTSVSITFTRASLFSMKTSLRFTKWTSQSIEVAILSRIATSALTGVAICS